MGPEIKHGRPRRWGLQNPYTWINLALSIGLAESYPAGKDEGQTIWKRMEAAFIEPILFPLPGFTVLTITLLLII